MPGTVVAAGDAIMDRKPLITTHGDRRLINPGEIRMNTDHLTVKCVQCNAGEHHGVEIARDFEEMCNLLPFRVWLIDSSGVCVCVETSC